MAQIDNFDPSKPHSIIEGTVAQPAVATDYAIQTIPAGQVWQFQSLYFIYSADANAANRRVNLRYYDNAVNVQQDFTYPGNITAGIAPAITFGSLFSITSSQATWFAPLFNSPYIFAGEKWQIYASSKQAGDQFSVLRYVVKIWNL